MNKSAVITGGGIGGLFTGAFLAKNGLKVTVLEKNDVIGGGLQCFRRRNKIFETGMHVMGGFEPGGSLTKICSYLGILDRLDIHHISTACMDELRYESNGVSYKIASGKEGFVKSLTSYFPDQEEGLKNYIDEIYRLTQEVPLFYLQETPDNIIIHSEKFIWPADKLIAEYISDFRLREILAYLNPYYGGMEGHTPAYIHALINVLYINGSSRFIGGSQQLADALKDVIEEHGGKVLSGKEVTRFEVVDKRIEYAETADGDRFSGDWYISSLHPATLLQLLPKGTFLRGFVNRINEIPNSYSAFSLYIDLKPNAVRYIDHTCYFMEDFGNMWQQDKYEEGKWPGGFMYMTPPEKEQGEYASRLLVHCVMDYEPVRRWENTCVGHRGQDYEQWKNEHTEMVLKKLEKMIPNLREAIAHVYSASPLTIRDYYHTKEGAMFGYRKDCENLIFSQMTIHTKVKNLLLTGQNINLHGICGVPLTAINTSEAILGTNSLVKAINDAYDAKN